MSKQLLIDTQALLWWMLGSAKLSEPTRSEMQIRLEAAETLLVSSWSIVELVYSTEKPVGNAGRVAPDDLDVVVETLLDPEHGFEIVPVDADVALRVGRSPGSGRPIRATARSSLPRSCATPRSSHPTPDTASRRSWTRSGSRTI